MRYCQCYVENLRAEHYRCNITRGCWRATRGCRTTGWADPSSSVCRSGLQYCTLHCILLLQKILSFDGVSSLTGDCEEVERLARLQGWEVVTSTEGEKSLMMQESEEDSEGEEDDYNSVLEGKLKSEEDFDEEWS